MLSLTVAAPLAFLPIVSLMATLRWMAVSANRQPYFFFFFGFASFGVFVIWNVAGPMRGPYLTFARAP